MEPGIKDGTSYDCGIKSTNMIRHVRTQDTA